MSFCGYPIVILPIEMHLFLDVEFQHFALLNEE